MIIKHHADDSTLMSYAAAALPESFSLLVAAHLEQCGRCRQRLQEAENIGGALISGLEATPVEAGSIDAVWAAIESGEPETRPAPRAAAVAGLPSVLADHLPEGLDGIRWRAERGVGTRRAPA